MTGLFLKIPGAPAESWGWYTSSVSGQLVSAASCVICFPSPGEPLTTRQIPIKLYLQEAVNQTVPQFAGPNLGHQL